MSFADATTWSMPARLPGALGAAAAVYAAAGIPVFPCAPGQKHPLTAHGFQDASTDPAQIDAWWQRYPTANIGIPTGTVVDVLDVDVHATGTGYPILRVLQREGLIGGWEQAVRSPSGGLHLYYPSDPDRQPRSWSRGRAHVDFRGTGGYIIAPPSTVTTDHGDRRYEIIARGRVPRPVDADGVRDLLKSTPGPRPATGPIARRRHRWSDSRTGSPGLRKGIGTRDCSGPRAVSLRPALPEPDTFGVLEPAATAAGLESRKIAATIRSAHRAARIAVEPDDPVSQGARSLSGIGR